jgi:hypothetical protein
MVKEKRRKNEYKENKKKIKKKCMYEKRIYIYIYIFMTL